MTNGWRNRGTATVLSLMLFAGAAAAQTLPGLWGSPAYRVQLSVAGKTVSGTFTLTDQPQAAGGTITGEVQPGGQAFTAEWTRPAGPDTVRFQTYLKLGARGELLTGYRWTEETSPASFSLHRAVNGQVPVLIGQDDPGSGTTAGPTGGTTGGTTGPASRIEVIVCESAPNGQPQNAGEQFTAPKSVVALVKYTDLPANSTVDWLWTLEGRTEAKFTKNLGGTGWHMHGLQSQTAIIPGTYQLTVSVNGNEFTRRTIVVRPAAGAAPTGTTTTTTTPPRQPGAHVVVCESVVEGQAQKPGTTFTKPKSLMCLVKYTDFPQNSELKWVWTRNGSQIATHTKVVGGTGWAYYGLTGMPTLTPGTYKVTVGVTGSSGTSVTVTVK